MSTSPNSLQNKKAHPCPHCTKAFSSTHQLAQHSRVHSGDKPYPCAFCERRFKQLSHLQNHTRLHTGERPFKCPFDCGRCFIQLSNLQQHLRTHTGDKGHNDNDKAKNSFFCNQCGKSFKSQSSLMIHTTKKHSEPTTNTFNTTAGTSITYACHICNQIFADETSLKNHVYSHQTITPITTTNQITLWTCTTCDGIFTSELALQTHLEQMKTDPKHQKNLQFSLSSSDKINNKVDKKQNELNSNNNIIFATLISNGNSINSNDQLVSANLIAQNLLTFNQTTNNFNISSIKPINYQNKPNNVNFQQATNNNNTINNNVNQWK